MFSLFCVSSVEVCTSLKGVEPCNVLVEGSPTVRFRRLLAGRALYTTPHPTNAGFRKKKDAHPTRWARHTSNTSAKHKQHGNDGKDGMRRATIGSTVPFFGQNVSALRGRILNHFKELPSNYQPLYSSASQYHRCYSLPS